MNDQTPVETVTEAIRAVDRRAAFTSDVDLPRDRAHAALASLAQHRDEIARVLWEHSPMWDPTAGRSVCGCGGWAMPNLVGHSRHLADAVLAYLGSAT